MLNKKYKFIDLFAGIGGFHLALTQNRMECVYASEIDQDARKTYLTNHKIDPIIFNDDIRAILPEDIPNHDILCAGFPCQPFSQAGYKKGFEDGHDSERGNLFFCILDILEAKRPKAFILENVRHLLKHDNGNTFKIISESLQNIDYSISYKIIKASDFNRPQHRPRIFIVGFDNRQVNTWEKFEFPTPVPLLMTMSDIFEGECPKKIGYTLRVGGRGSKIDDRRNWDSYYVNKKVVQLGPEEGKRMQGFPDDFILPKSKAKAMKQLGNSVCVDVVRNVSKSVKNYLDRNTIANNKEKKMNSSHKQISFNRGEWGELYAFLNILAKQKISFADPHKKVIPNQYITILDISHNNSDIIYNISEAIIRVIDTKNGKEQEFLIKDFLPEKKLLELLTKIKEGKGRAFKIEDFDTILSQLNIDKFKGNSREKADINLSFTYNNIKQQLQPLGIKSYIGAKPTLLNASSATNFIFEICNFQGDIETINLINKKESRSFLKNRLKYIIENKGTLKFIGCEKNTYEENLRKVDSKMPEIIANSLIQFYSGKVNSIKNLDVTDQQKIRIKDFLKYVMLGMFPNVEWNGETTSNGTIILENNGDLKLYHIIMENHLKDFLFTNTKFETPSTTRHRFGSVYKENDKYYIKLNLQLRME
jgi:DNA (cytosine-5)-methyltransferase 1